MASVRSRTRTQDFPQLARCVIGLDVGGTKVAGGVVSFPDGTIHERQTIPTRPERGGAAVLDDVFDLAAPLAQQANREGRQIHGIGMAVCELVDLNGSVTSRQTLDWPGLPIQERFTVIVPSLVESDVRAAALAEALFGRGKAIPSVRVRDDRKRYQSRAHPRRSAFSRRVRECNHRGKRSAYDTLSCLWCAFRLCGRRVCVGLGLGRPVQ
jgi:ROK family